VVVANKSAESKLVKAIKHESGVKAMPPGGKLSDEDIAKIVAWVDGGAKP
jgi:mono/diheme cytochrome c family protein